MKRKILINRYDLNLKMMLEGGQCFRWKQTSEAEWTGVMSDLVWVIKQFDGYIEYETYGNNVPVLESKKGLQNCPKSGSYQDCFEGTLSKYFRLHDDVREYYKSWSARDCHFDKVGPQYSGIRILDQDPIENIFSFICSSNNNIKRITSMVNKLCELYGNVIADLNGCRYYSFPTVETLAQPSVERQLRDVGFGYRAKYIFQSAQIMNTHGSQTFITNLKHTSYESAKNKLMKLPGIGAKVADCICLMSLGHLEAVPVDTHVFKIASEIYLPHLRKNKSVTAKIYNEIGNHFRELYGPQAGWAHAVLFCADLKIFTNEDADKSEFPGNRKRKLEDESQLDRGNIGYKDGQEIENGSLKCCREELHLQITFNSGQSYRWKEIESDVWRGVMYGRVWTLKQYDDRIDYTCIRNTKDKPTKIQTPFQDSPSKQLLYDYFRLDFPLKEYYKRWAEVDQHFKDISTNFYGLRMIRQDIVENLFAFVCSSNNTINRMRNMVETLCKLYGNEIANIDGVLYFDFPSVISLDLDTVEKDLRMANFGFRASYVRGSAKYIVANGAQLWFDTLSKLPYEKAKDELMKLPGVGAKVADCICLTALDHLNTIPVDTHVYQIATKYYLPHLKAKNKSNAVSPRVYQEIGDCFRKIFGDFAGWAHTVLFCSDLKQHHQLCSTKLK